MKNLPEKFDHLPQEFDRMAIWNGIEKPRPRGERGYYAGGILLLVGITALVITFGLPSGKQHDAAMTRAKGPFLAETEEDFFEKEPCDESADRQENPVPVFTGEESVDAERSMLIGKTSPNTESLRPADSPQVLSPQLSAQADRMEWEFAQETGLDSIPLTQPVALAPELVMPSIHSVSVEENIDEPQQDVSQPFHQSLSLRVGSGIHRATFVAEAEANSQLRSQLERPQLDYAIGLRYERILRNNFLLSLTADYMLIKDQILTTWFGDSLGQAVRVDYDLHNHYHLFSGQVEMGRRFDAGSWYWDVLTGAGVKLYQISEVDFFVAEGKLAGEEQVANAYRSSANVFATAQIAVGRHFGDHLTLRAGAQVKPGLRLTGNQTLWTHRAFHGNAFVECGWRF